MSGDQDREDTVEQLVQRSSLGTPGARALKARTPRREAQLLQRAARLRNELVHGRHQGLELGAVLEELGALDDAGALYEQIAAQCLLRLAEVRKQQGNKAEARLWEARAHTMSTNQASLSVLDATLHEAAPPRSPNRRGTPMADGDIHTTKDGDRWVNKAEGNSRASNTAPTKAEAQAQGRQMAIDRGVEHVIHNQDGTIGARNTYPRSRDPRSSKG